jgi:modulator of FtsH protease
VTANDWHTFYVIAGGAAAVLTGLIFVGVTLHTQTVMGSPLYRNRASAMMALLASQLGIALFVVIPEQPLWLLGVEVDVIAAYWASRTIRTTFRLHEAHRTTERPRWRWPVESVLWALWVLNFVAAGVWLTFEQAAGLRLLAAATIGMFWFSIWNAWVLVAEVAE